MTPLPISIAIKAQLSLTTRMLLIMTSQSPLAPDPDTYDLTALYTGYRGGRMKEYKNKMCLEGERG